MANDQSTNGDPRSAAPGTIAQFEVVEHFPAQRRRKKGPRDTLAYRAYLAAQNSPTRNIHYRANSTKEANLFYQNLHAFKRRYKSTMPIKIMRQGADFYIEALTTA